MTDAPPARVRLANLPTPLEELPRLSDALGVRILVKRDDLTGLGLGGNKTRKLERLCGDALANDCDVLVTGGGTQSNHVRQTAAAACRLGLDCYAVLGGRSEPETMTGNLLLDAIFGATLEFVGTNEYDEIEAAIDAAAARLAVHGRRPYAIPLGGASAPGVLAYVDAAAELLTQADDIDCVFVADGSGGTHAGLLAHFRAGGVNGPHVIGVDVGTRPELERAIARMAGDANRALPRPASADVTVDHDHAAPGYGVPSPQALNALQLVARTEGIVLDPVYTAKAMAALVTWVRDERVAPDDTVCFWHTGGAPALFASRYAAPESGLAHLLRDHGTQSDENQEQ